MITFISMLLSTLALGDKGRKALDRLDFNDDRQQLLLTTVGWSLILELLCLIIRLSFKCIKRKKA